MCDEKKNDSDIKYKNHIRWNTDWNKHKKNEWKVRKEEKKLIRDKKALS